MAIVMSWSLLSDGIFGGALVSAQSVFGAIKTHERSFTFYALLRRSQDKLTLDDNVQKNYPTYV